MYAVVFTPSVATVNETTTLNISLLCVTYFFHSYLFFVSFSILKSQFFHLLWILFCFYTAACSGLPFALFSAPSSFSKIRSLCQSHFKSVSCFNLLNLFFSTATPPHFLSRSFQHPVDFSMPFSRLMFPPNHVILYFSLFIISFLFPIHPVHLMCPSLSISCCLISYCCLSAAKRKKKQIISLHSSSGKHQRGTSKKDKNRKLMLFISFSKECLLAKTRALPQLYLNAYRQMSTDTSPWPAGTETQWKTMP